MKSLGKSTHEEDEYDEEEEYASKKDAPSINQLNKEGKNSDQKASATRSKHSVTEQRRRSKINERFQILRDLIPHSDQKRDTASFLLEVIEYVQFLQEKVHKYEGSYQGWSLGPTKLMPWRNSHWRVQSFGGHPQAVKNGSGPDVTFPGKLDESFQTILTNSHNPVHSDVSRSTASKAIQQQPELANQVISMPMPPQTNMSTPISGDNVLSHPLQRPVSDAQLTDCIRRDTINQEELLIEGGTISISSIYSQGLLNTLAQALQTAGVELSQASISVQIDIGKRADRGLTTETVVRKDNDKLQGSSQAMALASSGEDSDLPQKRLKT